ncbi:MAG: SUF system NifU family Fe-S cluster assembly protein [Verrucomicrobiota bacterium JB024]|nr:SUF system NifU family Fe-S cluster assembly protein [Verrucomicrobiota bacterium JB024]
MPLTPELYQEILLDHSKRPRAQGLLSAPTHRAEAKNPEAGDEVRLTLAAGVDGKIAVVGWEAAGSAVLRASCSLMSERIAGLTVSEAQALAGRFREFLTGAEPAANEVDFWEDLAALGGIRHLPPRVKCAMLPWRALLAVGPV